MVPVAVWISLPVVWINSWVILLAVIRLREPTVAGAVAPGPAARTGSCRRAAQAARAPRLTARVGWAGCARHRTSHRNAVRPALHRDALRDAYVLAGVVVVLVILAGGAPWLGGDARSYWLMRMPDPYPPAYGGTIGFNYAPVVAQLLEPLTALPWPVFFGLITASNLVALYILLGRWAVLGLLFPPVLIELVSGNITLWLAVVTVFALRWPALWAVPLLTKVTPGVGVLWHLFRGEWRALAIAAGTTAGLVAISALLVPATWGLWFAFLRENAGMAPPIGSIVIPFLWRVPVAIAVMVVAARTDRAWLIPVATVLATPVIWPATFSLLLAIPRLASRRDQLGDVEQPVHDVAGDRQDDGRVANPPAAAGQEPGERPAGGEVAGV